MGTLDEFFLAFGPALGGMNTFVVDNSANNSPVFEFGVGDWAGQMASRAWWRCRNSLRTLSAAFTAAESFNRASSASRERTMESRARPSPAPQFAPRRSSASPQVTEHSPPSADR
jgi:hypothetical protein